MTPSDERLASTRCVCDLRLLGPPGIISCFSIDDHIFSAATDQKHVSMNRHLRLLFLPSDAGRLSGSIQHFELSYVLWCLPDSTGAALGKDQTPNLLSNPSRCQLLKGTFVQSEKHDLEKKLVIVIVATGIDSVGTSKRLKKLMSQ